MNIRSAEIQNFITFIINDYERCSADLVKCRLITILIYLSKLSIMTHETLFDSYLLT